MYQVEAFLDRCLESLSRQTLANREILVIDDESTDGSAAIARAWAERDPTIRVIRQPNQGCAAARSRGLQEAQGLYVAFVDSDDWVEPDMLERLLRMALAHGAEVAQGGYREVYENDGAILEPEEDFHLLDPSSHCRLAADPAALITLKPTIWRRLYQVAFLKGQQLDFYRELRRFDDLPFQFEVFMKASRVAVIPDIFYNYRMGRQGQDVGATDERLYIHFEIFRILSESVAQTANARFERILREVQFNTHRWGHARIEPRLKRDYLIRAAQDFFAGRMMLSRWSTFAVLWRKASSIGDRKWLLRVLFVATMRGYLVTKDSSKIGFDIGLR
jgi:glycosyltransferase involved in cell wall biosynthesis